MALGVFLASILVKVSYVTRKKNSAHFVLVIEHYIAPTSRSAIVRGFLNILADTMFNGSKK